jgi:hypothetical protein
VLQLLSSPQDSRVYAPRCWRGAPGIVVNPHDPVMLMERYFVNRLAKEAIIRDFQERNRLLQRRQRMYGTSMSSLPAG